MSTRSSIHYDEDDTYHLFEELDPSEFRQQQGSVIKLRVILRDLDFCIFQVRGGIGIEMELPEELARKLGLRG